MLFRSVMIVWCCALTIVAAANHVPTQVAHHTPLLSAAHTLHCDAGQLSEVSTQGASCSCSKGPISDTLARNGANQTADSPSPSSTTLSSDVRLSVAVVEAGVTSDAREPLIADETNAATDPKIEASLAAHLKQRQSWARGPSKSKADARSDIETASEAPGVLESVPAAAVAIEQSENNAIIALSVSNLEELLEIRESWRNEPRGSATADAGVAVTNSRTAEDAIEVSEVIASDAQPAVRALPTSKTEIELALAALLDERESWGAEPSKSVPDARPLSVARTIPSADGQSQAAGAGDDTEDLSAYLARRETWGKRIGSAERLANRTQQKPLAARSTRVKNWAKKQSKNAARSRQRRVRVLKRRQPLRAYSTQRTWQERVLFPL